MQFLAGVLIGVFLISAFQNCGGSKFKSADLTSEEERIDHGLIDHGVTVSVFKGANQVSDAVALAVNTAYEIRALSDGIQPVAAEWSARSGVAGFANCAVTGTALLLRTLNCSSIGLAHVEVTLRAANGEVISKIFERNVAESGTTQPPSNLTEFRIPAGTGNGPWNTSATAVVVFRGQTLRIRNDDTTVHRLHTSGSPCPHGPNNLANGQTYDCVISAAHSATAANMYDHNAGTSAVFYVNAIDGAALYNSTKFNISGAQRGCVDCHGALGTSQVKNSSLAMIRAAIAGNKGGMAAINLSEDQLRAIEYELSK